MKDDLARLSEREKAVLRLLARGHDAKSAAQALGLSVHTVNERLRDARRMLGASSSREAARTLVEAEGSQENRAEKMGVDAPAAPSSNMAAHDRNGRARRRTVLLLGVALMLGLVASFLIHLQAASIGTTPQDAAADPAARAGTSAPAYMLAFDISAAGAPRVRPRLTVRGGEMASLARSGMGGTDFDIVALANPDPHRADHIMLTIRIVARGSRQLQTQRSTSVGFDEPMRVDLRRDSGGGPVVTVLASAHPVAG
jgi:DNA-binding CsgD family transcriptional regulator